MDLFGLAASNVPALEQRFAELKCTLAPAHADRMERFASRVNEDGRVSINMRQMALVSFLTFGRHQNIYEWAAVRAQYSRKSREEILRDHLGDLHPKRVAFDRHFDRGEQFRYGALNIGGIGAASYGEYCAVLADRLFTECPDVAYLRSDSLNTYVRPGPLVDEVALGSDAAPHTHRHMLAAVKHGTHPCEMNENQWPTLLCGRSDYIEAVFIGDATPSDLQAVRMLRRDYDVFFRYAFEDFRARLGAAERYRVAAFVMTLQLLDAHRVPLELVQDD